MAKSAKRHTQVINKNANNDGAAPGPVNTYKLPQAEVDRIFDGVKPEKFTSFSRTWPRKNK